MTGTQNAPMDRLGWTGVAIWTAGFLIEIVADQQKRKFRAIPENHGRFITQGLWAWSRHPNYTWGNHIMARHCDARLCRTFQLAARNAHLTLFRVRLADESQRRAIA